MPQSFDSLAASNPYRGQSYYKSPWQNFLSKLGFRTQADAWQENMSVQAAEYDAALAQKQFDTEYNDPVNQVARMRAAGLNPDIDGGANISPGEVGSMGEDPSTPMQSTGDEGTLISVASTAANMIMSGFSTAVGLVQSVQGIQSTHLGNIMKSLENETVFADFTKKLFPYMLPDSPDPSAGDGVDLFANQIDWKAEALKNAESFAGKLPRRMRSKFVSQIEQYWNSGPGSAESYAAWRDRVKNRRDFYSERGTFYSDIDDVLQMITEPLNEMSEKIFRQSQKTSLKESEAGFAAASTEQSYQNSLDGNLKGEAENAGNKLQKTNNETVETLNGTIKKITDSLSEAQEDGGVKGALAGVALALIAGVRLYLANVNTHVGSSSSSSFNPKTGATSQSRGFSLGF